MPKIYYERGVLVEFESIDQLSNGDIFMHDIKIPNLGSIVLFAAASGVPISEETKKIINSESSNPKVIDINNRLPQQHPETIQPQRPGARKAYPPVKDEPKLGFMCPSCHQSRVMMTGTGEKFIPNQVGESVIISSLKEPTMFINVDYHAYNNMGAYDLEDYEELLKFLNENDQYVSKLLGSDDVWLTMHELMNINPLNGAGYCPLCSHYSILQSWVNEYAQPTTPYFHTCRVCGGEMDFTCEAGLFNHRADNQLLKCEKCSHTTTYNVASK